MSRRRFDGRPARGVPAYRRMVPFLMRGRNESAVYFEQTIDLSKTLPWLEQFGHAYGQPISLFPLVLASMADVLHQRPRLNRFVSGRRIHERDGVWLSFAAKRKMDDDAPLSVIKRRFEPGESFVDLIDDLGRGIGNARSGVKNRVDREVDILLKLPEPLLDGAVRLLWALDRRGLAPRALLAGDPMYTSVFVANLGSLHIDAAYHHLYEHGNCPLFATVGVIAKRPVVTEGGAVEARPTVVLKYTYDERIEDGHYCAAAIELVKAHIADPSSWLGDPEQVARRG